MQELIKLLIALQKQPPRKVVPRYKQAWGEAIPKYAHPYYGMGDIMGLRNWVPPPKDPRYV